MLQRFADGNNTVDMQTCQNANERHAFSGSYSRDHFTFDLCTVGMHKVVVILIHYVSRILLCIEWLRRLLSPSVAKQSETTVRISAKDARTSLSANSSQDCLLRRHSVCIFLTHLVLSSTIFHLTILSCNVVSPRLQFNIGIGCVFSVYPTFADKSSCSCTTRFVVPRPTPLFIYCVYVYHYNVILLSQLCFSF